MLQFILINLFLLSLGTVVYVIVRALPRLDSAMPQATRSVFERWIMSEIPERADKAFTEVMGKSLRRLKVFLLKLDNIITHQLKKIKTSNSPSKKRIDFNRITNGDLKEE